MPITGECFCGDIKYQIDGNLFDAKQCHCSRCRKVFSAQASATAMVDPDDFTWLTGEDKLTAYVGGHGFGFNFCRQCGSTLCTVLDGKIFQVMLGCINGDPGVEIGKHIYVGSKAVWESLPHDAVVYDQAPPEQSDTQ